MCMYLPIYVVTKEAERGHEKERKKRSKKMNVEMIVNAKVNGRKCRRHLKKTRQKTVKYLFQSRQSWNKRKVTKHVSYKKFMFPSAYRMTIN